MRDLHKMVVSKNVKNLLFTVCLSMFFLRPRGLLFFEGQVEFARKCQFGFVFHKDYFILVCFFLVREVAFSMKTQNILGENQGIFFL